MSELHRTTAELEAGVPEIEAAPKDGGILEMVIRRPAIGEREVLDPAELSLAEGVVGDSWNQRPSSRMPDKSPHPDMQLNLMNARSAALIAGDRDRWPLCGDQLYVDLDLTDENLPAGTQLSIGDAVIEITDQPHRGCAKFAERFGMDARRFVNSEDGWRLHMRGINAKVVTPGIIRPGDVVSKR